MGMRGPQPTPTAILAKRGSHLARVREEQEHAAKCDSAFITMPRKDPFVLQDKVASERWDIVVEHMAALGVLSLVDEHLITRYSITFSRWIAAEEALRKRGSMSFPVRDDSGKMIDLKPYPEVAIAARLFDQLLRLEDRIGFSPAARASIRTMRILDIPGSVKTVPSLDVEPVKDKSRFFND